jgi:hypothetical protein
LSFAGCCIAATVLSALTKGKPPTPSRCFHPESRLNFIFDFEFEYRKHRTIKGDANCWPRDAKSAVGDDPSE